MWMTCCRLAGFSMAAIGSMLVTRPSVTSNPVGAFIQALTVTTKTPESMPLPATMIPEIQCIRGGVRSHP